VTSIVSTRDVESEQVLHHDLKSAGVDQVQRALKAGGLLHAMRQSFYSGGYVYTHVLDTKRGTQYRVSKQVMRSVVPAQVGGTSN